MRHIQTPIIPSRVERIGTKDELDLKAICVFTTIGFFLGDDTSYKGLRALKPGYGYQLDKQRSVSAKPYFTWYNTPRSISLQEATLEFKSLFDKLIEKAVGDKKVILPLSGGLDSRSLAAGLKHANANVQAYSYSFEGGVDETRYAKKIADAEHFPLFQLSIPRGYLWPNIDEHALTNECYAEFTHGRQMAFAHEYAAWGDVFMLGHWGDVLFDNMRVANDLPFEEQVDVLLKKLVKMGGMELGTALWQAWGLNGEFKLYLREQISSLLQEIPIENNANTRLRAFKSMHWAHRWTTVNLSVFEKSKPIALPYFDNEMCEFICTLPEEFLSKRKIQIEYLKQNAPELAQIEWQEYRPYNLYTYHKRNPWRTLPYRAWQRMKTITQSKQFVQRNWELQFLGEANEKALEERLFHETAMNEWIPTDVVKSIYAQFKKENPVYYAHAVSMLLTLSLFSRHFKHKTV